MIYRVNGYQSQPTYFVDQETYNSSANDFIGGPLIVGTQADADAKLVEVQQHALQQEAWRFCIYMHSIEGTNTTWRELREDDPEDIECHVSDMENGNHISVMGKAAAKELQQQKQQEYLSSIGLEKIEVLEMLPMLMFRNSLVRRYGVVTDPIPVEKL